MPQLVGWTTALAVSGVAKRNLAIFGRCPPEKIGVVPGWTRGPAGVSSIRLPHPVSGWWVVSTPYEIFRATLPVLTPDGEPATLIVTRQGQGSSGRVWVTFSGAWVTTAVMTDEDAERFAQIVNDARKARR